MFKLCLKSLLIFCSLMICIYFVPKHYYQYKCDSIYNDKELNIKKLLDLGFYQYSENDYYLYNYSFNGLYSCHATVDKDNKIKVDYNSKLLF